jgi:hypothetical protein
MSASATADNPAGSPEAAAATQPAAATSPAAEGPAAFTTPTSADNASVQLPASEAATPAGSLAAASSATAAIEPSSPIQPASPRADPCPFCLEPLKGSGGSLALPCGHAFHAVCTLQFLLKRKQCPVCRAPVDEGRVRDVGALPEGSGRSFLQQLPGRSSSKPGEGGAAGVIELHAVSGGWATGVAAAAGQRGGVGLPAQRFSSDGGQHWTPDIYPVRPLHGSSTPRALGILVEQPPADHAQHGDGASRAGPPLTIRVVRPRCAWLKPLLLGVFFLGLLALVVSIPITVSGDAACFLPTIRATTREPASASCTVLLPCLQHDCKHTSSLLPALPAGHRQVDGDPNPGGSLEDACLACMNDPNRLFCPAQCFGML